MTKEGFLKIIGENVARLRKEAELSQSDLANLLLVDRAKVNHLESGKYNSTIVNLKQVADALRVDMALILAGTESELVYVKPTTKRGGHNRIRRT